MINRPEMIAAIVGAVATIAAVILTVLSGAVGSEFLSTKKRKSLVRDIRGALLSFGTTLFPAADRGLADPDKWEPIIARISSLHNPNSNVLLRDDEVQALEGFVREATRALVDLRGATARVVKRLDTEPAPEQNESTRWVQAIEGVRYDPRTFQFRKEVKTISRPLYDHLVATRITFGDYTALLPDTVYKLYEAGNWKTRRALSHLYKVQAIAGRKPWWQSWKLW